jgi:hypothetical protein
MKIYLSSSYERRDELRVYRYQLREAGYTVQSRWLDEDHPLQTQMADHSPEALAAIAVQDLGDLFDCECVIAFTEQPGTTRGRGGRHVEFGFAHRSGAGLIVVGHRENIFHYLPCVEFFPDWESCLCELSKPVQPETLTLENMTTKDSYLPE